jgi:hypothetical protein
MQFCVAAPHLSLPNPSSTPIVFMTPQQPTPARPCTRDAGAQAHSAVIGAAEAQTASGSVDAGRTKKTDTTDSEAQTEPDLFPSSSGIERMTKTMDAETQTDPLVEKRAETTDAETQTKPVLFLRVNKENFGQGKRSNEQEAVLEAAAKRRCERLTRVKTASRESLVAAGVANAKKKGDAEKTQPNFSQINRRLLYSFTEVRTPTESILRSSGQFQPLSFF